ncbi:MAG: hypothetical protein H0W81_06410 [Chloroflexi bacterium]|nr:hypothetical protein [Chloroflexota bacterium]
MTEVAFPITGEVLDLSTADTGKLARARDEILDIERQFREVKHALDAEVLARMDRAAKWTLRADGLKLEGTSPGRKSWYDGPALREALMGLVDAGVIDVAAADAAVETVVTYKPSVRGIKALRKLGGEVEQAIGEHEELVDVTRRVSVSRDA